MRLWPRSLKWRTILLTLLGLVAIGGTAGYVWWWPIGGYISNQIAIWKDRDDAHPVTRGLARGEIRAGSSVEELIATHPPWWVARYGRFVEVSYADGPNLIAMDGKLVRAQQGGCIRHAVYFDNFSHAEEQEWYGSSRAESLSGKRTGPEARSGATVVSPPDPRMGLRWTGCTRPT